MIEGLIVLGIGAVIVFFELTGGLISNIIPIPSIIIYIVGGICVIVGVARVLKNLKWFGQGY